MINEWVKDKRRYELNSTSNMFGGIMVNIIIYAKERDIDIRTMTIDDVMEFCLSFNSKI